MVHVGDSFPKLQSTPTLCISMSKLYTIHYHSNSNNLAALLSFTSSQYLNYFMFVCLQDIRGEREYKRASVSRLFTDKFSSNQKLENITILLPKRPVIVHMR